MYLMIAQYRYRYRKSGKIYWLIPAIGISAKSHIGASLVSSAFQLFSHASGVAGCLFI